MNVYREFVACMAAYLRQETHAPSLNAQEWGKLYALAKRQSLSGALFEAVGQCDMPDAVRDRLRRDAFMTLARYETQQQVQSEFVAVLHAADIAHLLFKGAVTRRYYRNPAMRTMGDIDAAVTPAARDGAHAALVAAGFDKIQEQPEVWVYEKHGVRIELHTVLRRFDAATQDKEPYDDVWTDARQKRDSTFHLSDDAEIAYTIAHMASHFCGGGCGLRQLMDVAVLAQRFPDETLWEHALERLGALRIERFARHMLWLCEQWFGAPIPAGLSRAVDEATEEGLLCRMLSEGTFGTDERRMMSRMRQERRLHKSGGNVGMLSRWLFPTPTYLPRQYAYAENPLLLPVAYVHRLANGVTKNRRRHTARLQYAKDQQNSLEDEVQFFETIGL